MMLATAIQMKSLEEKLDEVIDVLGNIEEHVHQVLKGQQSDRIGLYYSGEKMYLESQNIMSPSLKSLVMSQAIKSLSDANAQEIQIKKYYLKNKNIYISSTINTGIDLQYHNRAWQLRLPTYIPVQKERKWKSKLDYTKIKICRKWFVSGMK